MEDGAVAGVADCCFPLVEVLIRNGCSRIFEQLPSDVDSEVGVTSENGFFFAKINDNGFQARIKEAVIKCKLCTDAVDYRFHQFTFSSCLTGANPGAGPAKSSGQFKFLINPSFFSFPFPSTYSVSQTRQPMSVIPCRRIISDQGRRSCYVTNTLRD